MLESKFEQRSSEIVQQGGQFFEKRTVNGVSNLFPIDLSLSPTRNPVEALQRQKINEGITFAQQTALAGPGLKVAGGLGRGLLDFVGARAPRLGQQIKGLFVKPRPVNLPEEMVYPILNIPGVDFLPAMGVLPKRVVFKGLEPTRLTKGLTLGAGVGALGILKADPTEMQEQVDALTVESKNQQLEEQVQSNQDLKSADLTTTVEDREKIRQEVADTDVSSAVLGDVAEEDIKETDLGDDSDQDGGAISDIQQTGITPFVDTQRFNDFIGAVGRNLVTTGQLGAGLAAGAVEAATIKQKRDLLAAEQQREEELLQKELDAKIEIEKLKGSQDLKGYQDSLIKLNEQSSEIEGLDTTAGLFVEAQNLLRTGDATGFTPLVSSFGAKVQRFFGKDPELTTREQAVIILEAIANGNVQEITGEPEGARISDADRQVARTLVGNLNDPLVDFKTALEKIDIQLNDIATRRSAAVDDFNILALGLPYEDVVKYSPKTTPLPALAPSAQTIPFAGPR
tara:strand:+ start:2099 stop:3631 length:1533 start_codon:yes stop_codon:yes gene_type:complete